MRQSCRVSARSRRPSFQWGFLPMRSYCFRISTHCGFPFSRPRSPKTRSGKRKPTFNICFLRQGLNTRLTIDSIGRFGGRCCMDASAVSASLSPSLRFHPVLIPRGMPRAVHRSRRRAPMAIPAFRFSNVRAIRVGPMIVLWRPVAVSASGRRWQWVYCVHAFGLISAIPTGDGGAAGAVAATACCVGLLAPSSCRDPRVMRALAFEARRGRPASFVLFQRLEPQPRSGARIEPRPVAMIALFLSGVGQ